jgi:OPA family glycerol-3-phosphate transporter-like MFS transporter
MIGFLKPAKFIDPLQKNEINRYYKRYRLQLFLTAYFGYMAYYFVRSTLALAKPYFIKEGLSIVQVGYLGSALAVTYGLSKFIMGNISDQSNPRYFLSFGLILSAIINLIVPSFTSYYILFILMLLNGWVQGMGWPPCGRIMVHWFSDSERGTKMSIWNTAHNLGAGILPILVSIGIFIFSSWYGLFYFPSIIAILVAILVIIFGRDTPQSVGLPPIEIYRNDYPLQEIEFGINDREQEMTSKQILFGYILTNKFVWYMALANVFVYCVRYGVINWAPTYLSKVKNFSALNSNIGFALFELSAIPGTILIGWLSDKFFNGRRSPLGVITMLLIILGLFLYQESTSPLLAFISLGLIGFLIYGPVMLIGVAALDLVPKKAGGTSAGFTGLFGYFFGTLGAEALMGYLIQHFGWNSGFILLYISCFIAVFFFILTWNVHNKSKSDNLK